METVEYAPGRLADLYGDGARRTVLMWHGAQTDARASMAPLAERVAAKGSAVVVADWDSNADDRGREDLLSSLRFARERSNDPDALTLVGWSLGGLAAAGATIAADRLGVRFAHTVCLAGAFVVPDPVSGAPLPADLAEHRDRAPFTLLHGIADDVVPVSVSREFALRLQQNAWPVTTVELDTDHAAIAGATYDAVARRYDPADDPQTLAVADEVAAQIMNAIEQERI